MILAGEHQLPLDTQRRFTVPYKWRCGENKNTFYLIYRHDARDPHIIICPKESFESITSKLPDLAFMNADSSKALLTLAHNMEECICDKQGRISIPEELKIKLKITKNIVVVGAFNHAQIWSPDHWESYKLGIESTSVNANQILELIN